MPRANPDIESFARIKVIGVGGSGGNAVNHMINSKVKGVEFVAINTDAQDLHKSIATHKIHIGKNITHGLGAGMKPEVGKKAAEETIEAIQGAVKGSNMVFIACGMGGGTGTGAAPIVAKTAKDSGALTVAVVTRPFAFEGAVRSRLAHTGLMELRENVDALIVIPNDRLLNVIEKTTTMNSAFAMCDDILRQAVEGISDLITTPGKINLDFADLSTVMKDAGSALMGIGSSSGERRAEEAARMAINSPLLEVSIEGARGVLLAIAGGEDLTLHEVYQAAQVVTESVNKDEANIIFGTINDERLKKNEIKITVIATGFPQTFGAPSAYSTQSNTQSNTPNHDPNAITLRELSEKEKPEDLKRVILNPIKKVDGVRSSIAEQKTTPDDDEWSSVPAFLRRSRLK
ncbi:MAG: cell division protein FtsZ [Candidatus Vogelbacteria bacterium]|nr:cell division protein FtsZ [Candidatus Vogelbacteria bacterium]